MHFYYWLRKTTLLIKKTSVCKITAVLYFWQQPHLEKEITYYKISIVWEIYVWVKYFVFAEQQYNDGQNHHPTQPEKPVNKTSY